MGLRTYPYHLYVPSFGEWGFILASTQLDYKPPTSYRLPMRYLTPDTTPPGGADVSGPRQPAYNPGSYCWDCGIGGGDNSFPLSTLFAPGGAYSLGTPMYDSAASEPYLTFSSSQPVSACGGSTRFIVFEDEQSLLAKGAFSRSHGYGGIIIWTLQQGYLPEGAAGGRPRNALMQALRHGFVAP